MADIFSNGFEAGLLEGAVMAFDDGDVTDGEAFLKFFQFTMEYRDLSEDSTAAETHRLEITFQPLDDEFDYPGGTPDPGELPTDAVGSIVIRDLDTGASATIGGLTGLTAADIIAIETPKDLAEAFYSGADTFTLGDAADALSSFGGADTVFAGSGADSVDGGAGADALNGQDGRDRLTGGSGGDRLFGGADDDRLSGDGGSDLLSGEDGDDRLAGGGGKDTLQGGQGADSLEGGGGADRFAYVMLASAVESGPSAKTRDTIEGFQRGADKIDFSRLPINDSLDGSYEFIGNDGFDDAGQVRFQTVRGGVLIHANMDDDKASELSIFLDGEKSVSAKDFLF